MFVVRDIFQLKFGKAREARESLSQMDELAQRFNHPPIRCLTDFTGDSYRLIMESEYDSLGDYEARLTGMMGQEEWKKAYQTFVPLVESSTREILRVV